MYNNAGAGDDGNYHLHYHTHGDEHDHNGDHTYINKRTSNDDNADKHDASDAKTRHYVSNQRFADCGRDTGFCKTTGAPWVEFGFLTSKGISRIVVLDRERRIKEATIGISVNEYATSGFCYTTKFGEKDKHTFNGKLV